MWHMDLKVVPSAIRCPWCHAEVVVAARDWVACSACLARHHRACWDEQRRCAACGGAEALVSAAAASDPFELERLRLASEVRELDDAWRRERGVRTIGEEQLWTRPATGHGCLVGALFAIGGVVTMGSAATVGSAGAAFTGALLVVLAVVGGSIVHEAERDATARFDQRARRRKELLDALARVAPPLGGTHDADRHDGREGREQPRPLPVLS